MILIEKLSFKIFPHSFCENLLYRFNVSLILCDLTFINCVFQYLSREY
jgi:hypothetical protein